jgi:MFS transporter, NNP family, nitrate/nitrite transporter
VVYLTVYSLLPQGVESDRIFFQMLGVVALMVAFLNAFFLKEPTGSHDGEHEEAPILVTSNADRQYRP